jgi:hypothetical protein
MKKNKFTVLGILVMVLALNFCFVGCDTGTNGGGGGLTLTIKNNYSQPITKVEMGTTDLTIDGLSVISEEPEGSHIHRRYEYTTSIATGASKVFSVKADSGKTQWDISVFVTADGLPWLSLYYPVGGLYGESYNRHFTVTVFPDGALEGDFED